MSKIFRITTFVLFTLVLTNSSAQISVGISVGDEFEFNVKQFKMFENGELVKEPLIYGNTGVFEGENFMMKILNIDVSNSSEKGKIEIEFTNNESSVSVESLGILENLISDLDFSELDELRQESAEMKLNLGEGESLEFEIIDTDTEVGFISLYSINQTITDDNGSSYYSTIGEESYEFIFEKSTGVALKSNFSYFGNYTDPLNGNESEKYIREVVRAGYYDTIEIVSNSTDNTVGTFSVPISGIPITLGFVTVTIILNKRNIHSNH